MLENKKLNMVLSLLIAIALWAFVIGEVNPEASRAYRDVPIQFINEEVLEQSGMALYSVSDRTMNVTLTGNRSEINKIDTKDILATVDLSDAAMGENHLRINLRVPNKVDVETQSANKVIVTVEKRVSKEIPVEISYEGTFNGEEEPITVSQNLKTVTAFGAETTINKVVAARANVSENSITADPQEIECSLIAVNSNRQRVYNVDLSDKSVVITSELAKLKTVPLEIPIEGKDSDGIERTVTAPTEITIKGKMADLDAIETIQAEPIYLGGVLESTTISVTPILPEDVDVSAESSNLQITVQVTKKETRVMTFDQSDVEIRGLKEGLRAELTATSIELTITGSESLVENLTKENVSVFVDLSDLGEGRHKVELQGVCNDGDATISIIPKKITVSIKSDAAVDKQPATDDENHDNNNEE